LSVVTCQLPVLVLRFISERCLRALYTAASIFHADCQRRWPLYWPL